MVYERDNFDIRSGTFGQAVWDGPKQSSAWNFDIWGGVHRFYAHIFRAAVRYHYGNVGVLRKPNFNFKLKYAAYDKKGPDQGKNVGNWSLFEINPNIFVYRYGDNGECNSDEVFSTTIHETAHSIHWKIMSTSLQFAQVNRIIQESYAIAVEWQITQMEYRERGISNYSDPFYSVVASYPIPYAYQYWQKGMLANYTSVFIDIIDDYNQIGMPFILPGNQLSGKINDQVRGYRFDFIENIMSRVYNLNDLSKELKNNKPVNVTDQQIDLLINSFIP